MFSTFFNILLCKNEDELHNPTPPTNWASDLDGGKLISFCHVLTSINFTNFPHLFSDQTSLELRMKNYPRLGTIFQSISNHERPHPSPTTLRSLALFQQASHNLHNGFMIIQSEAVEIIWINQNGTKPTGKSDVTRYCWRASQCSGFDHAGVSRDILSNTGRFGRLCSFKVFLRKLNMHLHWLEDKEVKQ